MTTAAGPIRSSVERIDGAVSKLQTSTTQTADIMVKGAQNTVQSAEAALKSASDILAGKAACHRGRLWKVSKRSWIA